MDDPGPSTSYTESTPKLARPRVRQTDEERKAKRRVPEDKRRRVEVSCDRCKIRKTRCLRDANQASCKDCLRAGVTCVSNLPRKRRIYATEEQLTGRYRALDAIVRHLYPNRDIESEEAVEALAGEIGAHPLPDAGASALGDGPANIRLQDLKVPEGMFMSKPAGGPVYVGPASSFVFAGQVREIVKTAGMDTLGTMDEAGLRRFLQASDFATFTTPHPGERGARGSEIDPSLDEPQFMPLSMDDDAGSALSRPGRLAESLPPREVTDALVRAFFSHVHPSLAILHRTSFQMLYDSIWTRDSASFHPEGVCVLVIVLVLGAQALESHTTHSGLTSAQQAAYVSFVVKEGLSWMAINASLTGVQALLLVSLFHFNAGERDSAYALVGQAARMAVALGMHRDGEDGGFDTVEQNLRRQVYWQLFIFEQLVSMDLGRPSFTADLNDVTTSLPDESVMDQGDYPPGYLGAAVGLTELAIKVDRFAAATAMFYDDSRRQANTTVQAEDLHRSLLAWHSSLGDHLAPEYLYPTARLRRMHLLLHVQYHHLLSLLGRGALLAHAHHLALARSQAVHPLSPSVENLAEIALQGARGTLDLVHRLAENDLLEPRTWLDLGYVSHAVMAIGLWSMYGLKDPEDRRAINDMLNRSQRASLAPTYRLQMQIATQFAYITGLAPDVEPGPSRQAGQVSGERGSGGGAASLEELFSILPAPPVEAFGDLHAFGIGAAPMDFFGLGLSAPIGSAR